MVHGYLPSRILSIPFAAYREKAELTKSFPEKTFIFLFWVFGFGWFVFLLFPSLEELLGFFYSIKNMRALFLTLKHN